MVHLVEIVQYIPIALIGFPPGFQSALALPGTSVEHPRPTLPGVKFQGAMMLRGAGGR